MSDSTTNRVVVVHAATNSPPENLTPTGSGGSNTWSLPTRSNNVRAAASSSSSRSYMAQGTELMPVGSGMTSGAVTREQEDDDEDETPPIVGASSSVSPPTVVVHAAPNTPQGSNRTSSLRARGATNTHSRPTTAAAVESKEEVESRLTNGPPQSSAAAAALAAAGSSSEEEEEEEAPAVAGPTAKEIYARPLLFYKRAPADRSRRNQSNNEPEPGPAQLILPDSGICLGFPPSREATRRRQNRDALPDAGESVVVFTPPNEEQASKTKLWACILFFLIPADVILICTIFFLGGAATDDRSYNAGSTDLVTFLCAIIALILGLIGMKLRDTRILTLFIVIYYVDAVINLVRVSNILQFAQFLMQVGVCHCMGHFKSTLISNWWIADM